MVIVSWIVSWNLVQEKLNYNENLINKKSIYNLIDKKLDYNHNYKSTKTKMWGQYTQLKLIKENQIAIKV